MAINHYSILILEDSLADLGVYHQYLNQDRLAIYDILAADSEEQALTHLAQNTPDLIILNYQLPGVHSGEFFRQIALVTGGLQIPAILLIKEEEEAGIMPLLKNGVEDYLVEGKITQDGLCRAVRYTLEKSHLRRQIQIPVQQAEANNQRFMKVLESTTDFVSMSDSQGKLIYMNKAGRQMMGAGENEDITLLNNVDFLPKYSVEVLLPQCLQAVIEKGIWCFDDGWLLHRSGAEIPTSWVVMGHKSPEGEIEFLSAIARDISDRKQVEAQLIHLSERLELALKSAQIGIWDWDIVNNSSVWDERMYEVYGLKASDFTSNCHIWEQYLHPDDLLASRTAMEQALAGVRDFDCEFRVVWPDGTIKFIKAYAIVQRDSEGQPQRMIGVNYDITERKQTEIALRESEMRFRQINEQLAASNAELARATRLKDEFLANMSHELRTPLNAILGISEGLQEEIFGTISEEQRRALQTIEHSGMHLLELIKDILDLAKIEAGQLELKCTATAIEQICKSSLAFIKHQALQKNIQLEVNISPDLPNLLVDERRIRQVLINLLSNAVKFTAKGGKVTLQVTLEQLGREVFSPSSYLRIAVIDTGIGIAPENFHKLFQPFVQIDSSLSRKYEGTGLGLALVKQIVEMHGGQVRVSSEIGLGSCFIVDLPYGNSSLVVPDAVCPFPVDLPPVPNPMAVRSPLILLAEDNEANIETISSYLKAKGLQIILAKNGLEAVAIAKSELPDLILMDIQMPIVDGLEATKQIRRELSNQVANIPIIALTGLAMTGDREKCLAAGANEYLSKPVKLKQLAIAMQQFLTAFDRIVW